MRRREPVQNGKVGLDWRVRCIAVPRNQLMIESKGLPGQAPEALAAFGAYCRCFVRVLSKTGLNVPSSHFL